MTCPVCATPAVPGARFCFACGAPLPTAAPEELEAERRVVTVLFGDLSDFTSWAEDLDPERVGTVVDRVLAALTGVVAEFGGRVDKLIGDGLMAVFGAPTTHEDDAERAVRAAARMQQAVRRVVEEESGGGRRLGLRVGLNTGEVLAGVQASLSYTVVGDTVNTASRLSDAAGVGAVLAGGTTALATMGSASWRALPAQRLKGKREPVVAYELVGLRPAGATRPGLGDEAPFLGRDAELGLLVGRLLETADRHRPRILLVTGEAGVGKTRLARELSRFVGEMPEARVLWGRCAPYGEARDLEAVAEMVRTACGIGTGDDVQTARRRVARTVGRLEHPAYAGPVPRGMAEQLGRLLGLGTSEPALPRDAVTPGGPGGGDQVRAAVAALFTALARDAPLLLVLDDLHWATPTMLDGLLDVASTVRGQVLLLGIGRPDMLAGDWWRPLPEVEVLPVLPLEDAALERLLLAHLGTPAEAVDAAVRDTLLERAQGNPFFLAELLHLLVDRGVLRRHGGRWRVEGELPDDVPAGVQAVLAARIDRLDGTAKGLLRDASVLGLRVTPAALAAVGRASGHGDPDVVRAGLATLVGRALLLEEEDGLRFGHTLVRDVAYSGLAKAERARRHAAAAAYAAGTGVVDSDVTAAAQGLRAVRLAAEMGLAPGDPSWQARHIAFAALARLGRAALARDDNQAAERVLARAVGLAAPAYGPELPATQLVPVQVAHAQALAALLRLAEAEAELAPALAAVDGVQPAALVVLADVRRKRGDLAGARSALAEALSGTTEAAEDQLHGEALRQLGLLDYFDGRLRAAEECFGRAYALAERVGDRRGAGWALQHLAWSATTRGDYALAERTLEQAAELFSALEDSGGLSWVAGTEGFVRLLQGRHAEARELAGTILPLGEAAGDRWGAAALLTIDALAAAELGEIEAAAAASAVATQRFAALGDPWGQSLALVAEGAAARGADDPDRAVDRLARAVELSERGHLPLTAILALVALGWACLDRADLDGAERAAGRAAERLSGLELEPHAALGASVLLAQVARARGDLPGALATLDAALAVDGAPALLFPRRQALAHRAGTLLELDRPQEALVAARQAVALPSEDVRARVLGLRALGSALWACGEPDGARAAFTEALAVARSTGQRSEVAATERLLAATG